MEHVNIMVIDDYLLVAEGIKELLTESLKPGLIKHFDNADESKKELHRRRYHQLFIGIKMHGRFGDAFIEETRARFPKLIIVALCAESDTNTVSRLFALGINGIISKHEGMQEIELAMQKITKGERYISVGMVLPQEDAAARIAKAGISKRESEVMRCVANGNSILETANILQLSHHTIITHRRNIMAKLQLKSATEMACYIYQNRLFHPRLLGC